MKLTFIGAGGSMGLEHGKKYDCKIFSGSAHNLIWVEWFANGQTYHCPYASLKKLLENWEE